MQKTDFDISFQPDKKVVLLCDDSKICLQITKQALIDHFHVITASSGYEAVAFASLYSPDIIVLDIMMYGMDGLEAFRRLKMNMVTKDIPVVFMTAVDPDQCGDRLRGSDGFIKKPVKYDTLIKLLKDVICAECVE